jgi:hypothetical protein
MYGDADGDGVLSANEAASAGGLRTLYLSILIPHIILAAGVLPVILLSFYRGLQMQVEKHKKLVRWAFPIWLFVTVSGVVVYLMISPYYHFWFDFDMKKLKFLYLFLVFGLMVCSVVPVKAQCAMCSANVETNAKSGAGTTNGLNSGIMYLLAAPYLAVAAVGYIWYKKYRRKNVDLNMRNEKLNLN